MEFGMAQMRRSSSRTCGPNRHPVWTFVAARKSSHIGNRAVAMQRAAKDLDVDGFIEATGANDSGNLGTPVLAGVVWSRQWLLARPELAIALLQRRI